MHNSTILACNEAAEVHVYWSYLEEAQGRHSYHLQPATKEMELTL